MKRKWCISTVSLNLRSRVGNEELTTKSLQSESSCRKKTHQKETREGRTSFTEITSMASLWTKNISPPKLRTVCIVVRSSAVHQQWVRKKLTRATERNPQSTGFKPNPDANRQKLTLIDICKLQKRISETHCKHETPEVHSKISHLSLFIFLPNLFPNAKKIFLNPLYSPLIISTEAKGFSCAFESTPLRML